jgi:hypothetical protein
LADVFKEIAADAGKSDNPDVLFWQKELDLAKKREKKFRKDAQRVVSIYEAEKREDNSFNILYANTETLLPACYNQMPRPFVDRRFKDADPLAKQGATAIERLLIYLQDSGNSDYDTFDKLIEQAVLGALVPGRGLTRFKYEPHFESAPNPVGDQAAAAGGGAAAEEESGEEGAGDKVLATGDDQASGERVSYETVCGQDIAHDDVLFGYARRWIDCPWAGFRHEMSDEDVAVSFGLEWVEKLKFDYPAKVDEDGNRMSGQGGEDAEDAERGSQKTCEIWELWNKEKMEVVFYSASYKEGLIKKVPDPLGISGFFPCPEPLQFLLKRDKMTPTPMYILYEQQAKELNRLTMRINRILNALKVRGFYDGTMQGLQELLTKDDNTFIPVKQVAALQQGQNLTNSFTFMPLGELITVLQQLYMAREQLKGTIYELTGISDIMRGETVASETLGAQKLKSNYGGQRLSRMQRYVQRYARDCLRIMAEIGANHFAIDTWASMTNLDYATPQQVQQAMQTQQQLNQAMMAMQQQAAMQPPPPQAGPPGAPQPGAPPPGPPGMAPPGAPPPGPPQPPQPPPQMQQAMQQAQDVLSKPKWQDVYTLIHDNMLRDYRIDIETNSTLSADTDEDKQNVTEAVTAMSNMFQAFAPAVEKGAITMPVMKQMTLAVVRRFNFGRMLEDAVSAMPDQLPTPPPPPGTPTPAEMQAKEAEAQQRIAEAQQKGQLMQQQQQLDAQKAQNDSAKMAREEEMAQKKHALTLMQIDAKMAETQMKTEATRQQAGASVQTAAIQTAEAAAKAKDAQAARDQAAKDRKANRASV